MTNEQPPSPEQVEQPSERRPRIYVASLSDYNAGRLHGSWIDATSEPDAIHEQIHEMLADSIEPIAEEWAIHDHDNFGRLRLGEYESIEAVSLVARGINEHGEAFAAWASLDELEPERLAQFEEAYRGTWSSLEDYADNLLDDVGATQHLEQIPDWLQPYVSLDVAAFARDLELSGDITSVEGQEGVYVFDGTL
jgi:antirestriction protein